MAFWYAGMDYLEFLMNFSQRNEGKRSRTGRDRELVVGNDEQNMIDNVPDVVDGVPDDVDGVPAMGMVSRLWSRGCSRHALLYYFRTWYFPCEVTPERWCNRWWAAASTFVTKE